MRIMAVITAGALLLTACGDDGDDTEAGEPGETETTEGEGGDGPDSCTLEEVAVGEAVGAEIVGTEFSGGGIGSGSGSADFDASGGEATVDGGYSLAWDGCSYTTGDGVEYVVAPLVDGDGNADVSGLEHLIGLSTGETRETGGDASSPEIGDESYVADDAIVARVGDTTLAVGFERGSNPTEQDMETLAGIAGSLTAESFSDVPGLCETAVGMIPPDWEPAGEVLAGSGASTSEDGGQLSYDSCSVSLVDGTAGLEVKVGDASLYDALRDDDADSAGEDAPEAVDGIGDAAVWRNDRLFVLVGDQGVMVTGAQDDDDQPADPATVEALAKAAVEALG